MADIFTPKLGLTKPDVGGSDDTWGEKLNSNFDILDTAYDPASTGHPDWDDVTGKPDTFPPSPHNHPISDITNLQTTLDGKQALSAKGAVNGYAPLDASAKVPAANLPSYVDDVLEYPNLASFPATGATGVIYIALDTNKVYRWSGSAYIEIGPTTGGGSSVYISDTPPVGVTDNSLWWKSDVGVMYVRYNDGNSTQWVQAASAPGITGSQWSSSGANIFYNGGNVGIGTASPTTALEIQADVGAVGTRIKGRAADNIGAFQFMSNAGAVAASIWNPTTSSLAFSTGTTLISSERMRIDSSGKVGIGTTAPNDKFHVSGNDAANITGRITNANAAGVTSWAAFNDIPKLCEMGVRGSTRTTYGSLVANDGYIYSNSNLTLMVDNATGVIKFATGGSGEKMRIDSAGNVGIGATPPANVKLWVTGNVVSTAQNNVFGTPAGSSTAPEQANTNILLYDYTGENWAGIGADGNGNAYFVTAGMTRVIITNGGGIKFDGQVANATTLVFYQDASDQHVIEAYRRSNNSYQNLILQKYGGTVSVGGTLTCNSTLTVAGTTSLQSILSVGLGGAAAHIPQILINGGNGVGGGPRLVFQRNSDQRWIVGQRSSIFGDNSDNLMFYNGPVGVPLEVDATNNQVNFYRAIIANGGATSAIIVNGYTASAPHQSNMLQHSGLPSAVGLAYQAYSNPGFWYGAQISNIGVRDYSFRHDDAFKPGGGSWSNSSSDIRTKNVLNEYEAGLDEILQLRPIVYTYRGNDTDGPPQNYFNGASEEEQKQSGPPVVPYKNSTNFGVASACEEFVGLVAQEAEKWLPRTVKKRKGYIDGKLVDDLRQFNDSEIIYALINAVKQLNAKIEGKK